MKNLLILTLISALLITLVPPVTYGAIADKPSEESEADGDTIRVFLAEESTAVTMDFREYITGVVAAEMPVEFHEEALSAAACAAATLARLKMQSEGDEELQGAVISTDPKKHQAFITKEEMKERWNGNTEAYYEKLTRAVDKAIDYSITYNGRLITPVYHSMSTGLTENAENVWGSAVPYLVSVESPGDPLAPGYEATTTLSFDEFREKAEENGAVLGEDITLWLGESAYTEAGTLKSVSIGGKDFSGAEIRNIFSLRSSAVTFAITKDGVSMTTRGYGHGAGLSQYGADYLAEEGYTWQEILRHYYTGVEIEIM